MNTNLDILETALYPLPRKGDKLAALQITTKCTPLDALNKEHVYRIVVPDRGLKPAWLTADQVPVTFTKADAKTNMQVSFPFFLVYEGEEGNPFAFQRLDFICTEIPCDPDRLFRLEQEQPVQNHMIASILHSWHALADSPDFSGSSRNSVLEALTKQHQGPGLPN